MSEDEESANRARSANQAGSRKGAVDSIGVSRRGGPTAEAGVRDGSTAETGAHERATVEPGERDGSTAESGEHKGATAEAGECDGTTIESGERDRVSVETRVREGETVEVKADGRRARGQRRRTAIIEAALRVVERDGASGLSHRAIAREAGVPASSAVYYFASMDDLLIAALAAGAEDYAEQFRRFADADQVTEGISAMIAESGDTGRERTLAEYELVLLAVRRPALRPLARRWMELLTEIARGLTDDPVAVRAFVAAADGLCMESLLHDEGITAAEVHAVLSHILRRPH